jgi:hypothetical protein
VVQEYRGVLFQILNCNSPTALGFERKRTVTCKSCGSDRQSKFTAEVAIHIPGRKGLEKPLVWVFPVLLVCLNCWNAEFAIPETDLRVLAKGHAAAAG